VKAQEGSGPSGNKMANGKKKDNSKKKMKKGAD